MKKSKLVALAVSALAVVGGVVFGGAPANAVTPYLHYTLHEFSAYDFADSTYMIQHTDYTTQGQTWGNWAYPGNWSNEAACWAGVTSYHINSILL